MDTDTLIREIFQETKTFACVGASMKPARPSYYVSEFLIAHGYRVIPVNPGCAGQEWLGETVYASLTDIPKSIRIDALDIFRRSNAVPAIVQEAKETLPDLKYIWTQLDVVSAQAAALATSYGFKMVQNRCPKIEIPRLIS
jgi:predicted CoA-binding protein